MERFEALNVQNCDTTIVASTTEKIVEILNGLYSQALRAKQCGQHGISIELFHRILENDEIIQANNPMEHRQQLMLKYCCYKNLAELHELLASHEHALQYFLLATDMDDNDVYFMNKFGYIALQHQQFDLANAIFQRCLKLNSNHLPSYDGILDVLCQREDYFEAYGWSIYCHSKFPKYQRPIDVIHDARDFLKSSPLLENAFTPAITNGIIGKRSIKPSQFPLASYNDEFIDQPTDFSQFKQKTVSFLTFGHLIKSIYNESSRNTSNLMTKICLSDICDINEINNTDHDHKTEIINGLQHHSMESDSCIDSTIEAIVQIFREIIPHYFSDEPTDDEVVHAPSMIRAIGQPGYLNGITEFASDEHIFHTSSFTLLQQFVNTLKSNSFDTLTLVFEWLKCISQCAHILLPIALQSIYIEIYEYLSNHMDWHGLMPDIASNFFRMSLLYIELKMIANVRNGCVNNANIQRFFDDRTMSTFYNITIQKSLLQIECDCLLEMRINVLYFQLAIELNDYDLAYERLECIQLAFLTKNCKILQLPNQFYCPCIDSWIVTKEKSLLECLQQEKDVIQIATATASMYNSNGQFDNVMAILLKYQQRHFTSVQLPFHLQLELLIEMVWMMDQLEECLRWCEKGLNDSMSTWCKCMIKKQQYPQHLAQHTRFLTVYLQRLLRDNHLLINSLNGRGERLVRSMAYLFAAQYHQQEQLIESLFDSDVFIETLDLILKNDQHFYDATKQSMAVLNIIGKLTEWIIQNNTPNDGTFLMCTWNRLNFNGFNLDMNVLKFNRIELIRLLSHSLFGYPNVINDQQNHQIGCTCKRQSIDWNGVSLLFTSFDSITNGMPESELKSLINDLLNKIPNDVQMNLCASISQLNDFLHDICDFPYKCIPMKTFPIAIKDIFHRIANNFHNDNDYYYGGYNYEQLIKMDLVLNPNRFGSWYTMLNIKISQLNALFTDSYDLTKINLVDVKRLKCAIDACFDKCEMFNQAENTITNVDHLWCYGLHLYKFSNNFTMMKAILPTVHELHQSLSSSNWSMANNVLRSYLMTTKTTMMTPTNVTSIQSKSLCYFLLGKMAEKKKFTKQSIEFYQMAERQLFDQQNDVNLQMIKLEINFRITASIYKYIMNNVNQPIDKNVLSFLLHVLKRDRKRSFNDTELAMRIANNNKDQTIPMDVTNTDAITTTTITVNAIDENANQVNDLDKDLITEIQQLCTMDFEWYLELCPNYYKAAYYLIKINLNKDDGKCRSLLLQLPHKNQPKKLSLFDIHRRRHLFRVKDPLHLSSIHDMVSFGKYMEKCVRILIKYLANNRKPNWYLQFVLALQWNKLLRIDTMQHLKLHQKQCLFTEILENFIGSASQHVKNYNRSTAKGKNFLDFYINIYELYTECETIITLKFNTIYSELMIECYRLCCDENGLLNTDMEQNEFQLALNFCRIELNNRANAKKATAAAAAAAAAATAAATTTTTTTTTTTATTKVNKPDNNPSSTTNNPKKRRTTQLKSNQLA